MTKHDDSPDTPAKKKLVKYLLRRDSSLNENSVEPILSDLARFVKVVHKIYTEPQAQISYKTKDEIDWRYIRMDYEELKKVWDKNPSLSFQEAIKLFNKIVTKDQHD